MLTTKQGLLFRDFLGIDIQYIYILMIKMWKDMTVTLKRKCHFIHIS